MRCSCPKCSAQIELDSPSVPEKGEMTACPECGGRFWRHREPFALRAYRKEWKIFCDRCGGEPGADELCGACGQLFPDYWVVQTSKPAQRNVRTPLLPRGASSPVGKIRPGMAESPAAGEGLPFRLSGRVLGYVGGAVLLAVLGLFLVNAYSARAARQQFARNYVVALYGIKSGLDMGLKKGEVIEQGRGLSSKDLADLKTVKDEVDVAMAAVGTPPEEFVGATERLTALYQVYTRVYALDNNPPGSPADFAAAADKLEDSFAASARELKAALPEELAAELAQSVTKYRNLAFLVGG